MPATIDPQVLPPASKNTLMLDIAPLTVGPMLQLPVLVARGRQPGKTIVVLGGVHGDEYEGMTAVRDVFRLLDPWEMRGNFIGVPVCNPPAFAAKSRTSPIDGLNLARVFPGQVDGTISQQIAHVLTTSVLLRADFLIDLHSSGSYMAMAHLIGYFKGEGEQARVSREAALRFGIPLVWGHESVAEGRSLSPAHERGIPWLYTECPSGGWLHEDYARSYADGVRKVMRYLEILSGTVDPITNFEEIAGEGDTDKSLTAPIAGFLRPRVALLAKVRRGDVLGIVEDLAGVQLAEISAPVAGMVILRRNTPSVVAGDLAFLLT
ncbi:succinylglutamate desuccinylase/aspartoacylase family protein [soil metagenome]